MITIDSSKCTGCGICTKICHEHCMFIDMKKIHIDYNYCSTCTQCIAICPNLALSWNNIQALPFNNKIFPSSEQIDEILKQRRTIRFFKNIKPDRNEIEEIINYGAYAPTHNFNFRTIIVDDDIILNTIDTLVFKKSKLIYSIFFKHDIFYKLIKIFFPAMEGEYLRAKPKLKKSIEEGKAYSNMPPMILFIIGNKGTPLSVESAQYLLYNMDIYGRTKGIGFRILVGNLMFINKNKNLRSSLDIKKYENIYAAAGIGFPEINFRNKVMGKKIDIKWN